MAFECSFQSRFLISLLQIFHQGGGGGGGEGPSHKSANDKFNIHPILTIMFKNVLRTFEAEILKIFKNIPPQPKN